jgi:hypothetical protein
MSKRYPTGTANRTYLINSCKEFGYLKLNKMKDSSEQVIKADKTVRPAYIPETMKLCCSKYTLNDCIILDENDSLDKTFKILSETKETKKLIAKKSKTDDILKQNI